MANFNGSGRSNFFKVHNEDVFREFFPFEFSECADNSGETQFMIVGDDESGGFENGFYDDPVVCITVKTNIFEGDLFLSHDEIDLETDDEVEAAVKAQLSEMVGYTKGEDDSFCVTCRYEEGSEFDMGAPDMISDYLADGEVAVFMEVGNEKLRYLSGHATAVDAKGKSAFLSLDHISDKIEQELGVAKGSYSMPTYQETVSQRDADAVRKNGNLSVPESLAERLSATGQVKFIEDVVMCEILTRHDGDLEVHLYKFQDMTFDGVNESLGGGTCELGVSAEEAISFAKSLCPSFIRELSRAAPEEGVSTSSPGM